MNKSLITCYTLVLFSILFIGTNANTHELRKLHKLCLRASDYKGCIDSNKLYSDSNGIDFFDINNIWRLYGPLRINWSAWNSKGNNHVAPALNRDDKPIYIAINCKKNKLNTTGVDRKWKGWFHPDHDFENQLLNDYCLTNR